MAANLLCRTNILKSFATPKAFNTIQLHSIVTKNLPGIFIYQNRGYRGSNRDIRRRERRVAEQLKRQRDVVSEFHFPTFIRFHYDKEINCFQKRLKIDFNDIMLLKQAFTHVSFLNVLNSDQFEFADQRSQFSSESGERLALYGNIFCSQTISDLLARAYPIIDQNILLLMKRQLLSRSNISKLASHLAIPDLILIQHELETINTNKSLSYAKDDVICDVFYAIIGAICFDQGEANGRKFILDFLWPQIHECISVDELTIENSETILGNMLLRLGKEEPVARILSETGKKTDFPFYNVGIFSGNDFVSQAGSYSVEKAKEDAFIKCIFQVMEEEACLDNLQ